MRKQSRKVVQSLGVAKIGYVSAIAGLPHVAGATQPGDVVVDLRRVRTTGWDEPQFLVEGGGTSFVFRGFGAAQTR
jgi:hypothetical protein